MPTYSRGTFVNVVEVDPRAWEAELRRADELGCDHVELWLEHLPTLGQYRTLEDLVGGRTSIVHGPFIGMSLATDWAGLAEASVARCAAAIEIAGRLGAEVITFHGGVMPYFSDRDAATDRLLRRLERLRSYSEPVVALENMATRRGVTVESVGGLAGLARLADLDAEARFTLDIGHALQDEDDVLEFLSVHGDRVSNVHVHDARAGGRAHLPIGEGDLDLPGLAAALDDLAYRGYVTLETLGDEATRSSWWEWDATERQASARRAA